MHTEIEDPVIPIKVQPHVLAHARMETALSVDDSGFDLAGKLALYYTQQRVCDSFEVAEFLGEVDKNATVDFRYGLIFFLFNDRVHIDKAPRNITIKQESIRDPNAPLVVSAVARSFSKLYILGFVKPEWVSKIYTAGNNDELKDNAFSMHTGCLQHIRHLVDYIGNGERRT